MPNRSDLLTRATPVGFHSASQHLERAKPPSFDVATIKVNETTNGLPLPNFHH
jgi:hypothetical protein